VPQALKIQPQVCRKFVRVIVQPFRHLLNVRFRAIANPPQTATFGAKQTYRADPDLMAKKWAAVQPALRERASCRFCHIV
jgi:predicted SnoaL-like aldol condensation-catalyzing enzyme